MLTFFLLLVLLFVLLTLFIITSAFFGFLVTRVPFVRTPLDDIRFIVSRLQISSNHIFYDLGSGDGRVCFLVNSLTGAKCVGFELTWWTYLLAQLKRGAHSSGTSSLATEREERVSFQRKNFFKENWSSANYIYAYLYPMIMDRVETKFLTDCKPGSTAIIRDFPFPNLQPSEVYYLPGEHEIYVYRLQKKN